jgi:hypothetical protein
MNGITSGLFRPSALLAMNSLVFLELFHLLVEPGLCRVALKAIFGGSLIFHGHLVGLPLIGYWMFDVGA